MCLSYFTRCIYLLVVSSLGLVIADFEIAAQGRSAGIRDQSKDSILFLKKVERKRDSNEEFVSATATGFVISANGNVLTTAHLMLKPDANGNLVDAPTDPNVEVRYYAASGPRDSRQFELSFITNDRDVDVALFQLPPTQKWTALEVTTSSSLKADAWIAVFGFGRRSELSSGEGFIRNLHGKKGRFETSLPINRGDSGAPVFDLNGKVVAMAEGGV
jgi:serine protease Do